MNYSFILINLICKGGDDGESLHIGTCDNKTRCKVTVNVTQMKSGIMVLIFILPSDLHGFTVFKFPQSCPSFCHCCSILCLRVIPPPVALFFFFSPPELLIQIPSDPRTATPIRLSSRYQTVWEGLQPKQIAMLLPAGHTDEAISIGTSGDGKLPLDCNRICEKFWH